MANPHRGELVVQMGEKEYKTRLNFDLMAKIESRTGPVSYTHLTLPTIYSV